LVLRPPSKNKAAYRFINCDQPGGQTGDANGNQSGMNFADLPGFIANSQFMPSEGDEYAICDCNDTALGNFAKVETIGGGSNCVSVRASQTAQNTLASISDGTNDVGFTGTVGCSFQASVAGTTTLTVTSTNGSGALFPNDVVSGGVTGGTTIQPYGTGGTTGVGGVGTYALSGNSVATVAQRSCRKRAGHALRPLCFDSRCLDI
jgi:hypothetical protein